MTTGIRPGASVGAPLGAHCTEASGARDYEPTLAAGRRQHRGQTRTRADAERDQQAELHTPDDDRHPSRGEIPPGTRGTEAPGATTEGTCTRACGRDATRTDPELWSRDSARTPVLRGTEKGERPPSAGRIHRGRGEKGRRQAHGNDPSRDVAQGNAHGNEPSRDIAWRNQPAPHNFAGALEGARPAPELWSRDSTRT